MTNKEKSADDEFEGSPSQAQFLKDREYLQAELKEIREGRGVYFTIEEVDERLEATILKHINNHKKPGPGR